MVLHLDLDSFFVAVERVRRPELIGWPVIVGGRRGGSGTVASASREARKCGVRAGMPLADAAIRCPDGAFLEGAFDACFAAAVQVDELLRRESPEIEWQSIDEVFVGLPAAGGPRAAVEVAERLHAGLNALGFDAACGIARSKLVARMASQLGRPRGVVHVLDGYEARFLAPLKIEMLPGIDAVLARRLRSAGIRRLGQIATLSASQLAPLAGRQAETLARRAAGIDASRIRRTALPPAPTGEYTLRSPTADAAMLREAVRVEAERIGRELRARGVFARTMTVRLRFADGRVDSRTAPLDQPTALDDALLAGAMEILPRLWNGGRAVRAVGLSCSGLLTAAREPALFPISR